MKKEDMNQTRLDRIDLSHTRGLIEYNDDGSLTISARDGPTEVTLSPDESDLLAQSLRAFLSQTIRLYENPPNKSHLTLGGETICHYNARGPGANVPYGTLTANTPVTYNAFRYRNMDDETELALEPKKALAPLSVWEQGILPQTNVCQHCRSKAVELGLLHEQDLSRKLPGTQTPPCPECGTALHLYENKIGNAVDYKHENPNEDCPLNGRQLKKSDIDDSEVTALTKKRLGIADTDFQHAQTHTVDYPEVLSESTHSFAWRPTVQNLEHVVLTVEDDNSNIPTSILALETEDGELDVALLFPDLVNILQRSDEQNAPPSIPSKWAVIDPKNINQDGGQEMGQTRSNSPTSDFSAEVLKTALAPLEHSLPDTMDFYRQDCVEAFADHYGDDRGDGVRESVIEAGSARNPLFKTAKPPSRHFHQTILAPSFDELQPLLTRLGVPEDDIHHLVYGGFTGELAAALNHGQTTVTFTDPSADWCDHARENYDFETVGQYSLSAIPARHLREADTAISFECFHPVEGTNSSTLFPLLKASTATHGLFLVVSDETTRQMEHENNGKINQLKSKWNVLTQVYDLETRWADSEKYRIWNLRPESTGEKSPAQIVDLLTIRTLSELGLAVSTDRDLSAVTTEHPTIPYPDTNDNADTISKNAIPLSDHYGELVRNHPVCDSETDLAQSLGRLGTVFNTQISMDSRLSKNRILLGKYEFALDGPERDLTRSL